MINLLRRPRPKLSKPPTNFDTECWSCGHGFHGLACRCAGCPCPTAWVEP